MEEREGNENKGEELLFFLLVLLLLLLLLFRVRLLLL